MAGSRTALVMPIYNEDPAHTTAALQAMAEALAQIDAARHFEIAIISDSTKVDAWINESLAIDQLRRELRETCRSGTGAAGTTPAARPATSRSSSSAGADVTTT